ncbi:MAG: D-glycero-beta-D-manno-heptose 1,7-bisphosphate 7-phosphatase [Halothiobacillaceae bacterium]
MKRPFRLIILDRDGVINQDSDEYVKSVDEWIPLPGALEAIVRLKQAGWTVAVATNQSGIARGLFSEDTLQAMHEKMARQLAERGAHIDYITWCPHGPDDGCDCRKPRPGLYQQIARHFDCSLENVPVVGDSARDLEAAVAVGARPVLVLTGKGARTRSQADLPPGVAIFESLSAAVPALLQQPSLNGLRADQAAGDGDPRLS